MTYDGNDRLGEGHDDHLEKDHNRTASCTDAAADSIQRSPLDFDVRTGDEVYSPTTEQHAATRRIRRDAAKNGGCAIQG